MLGALLESELKQPVIVANRSGGSAWSATRRSPRRDRRLHHRHDHGRDRHDASRRAHPLKPTDYTPIGLVNADPQASPCAPIRLIDR
jgi:hypothetical protein